MAERFAALVMLIAGAVYVAMALAYPRGVAAKPGPGFYPLIVGTIIVVAAAVFVYQTFRHAPRRAAENDAAIPGGTMRVWTTAGVLAFFCLALPWIGFVGSAFVFVTVMLRALGGSWRVTLATAVVSASLSFYVFGELLQVPLPKGAWLD